MEQLLVHMKHNVSFRGSLNTFIKEPSDALLTELMRAVLGKFNNDIVLNLMVLILLPDILTSRFQMHLLKMTRWPFLMK